MKNKLLIIDVFSILYRAYHGTVNYLTNTQGQNIGAVYTFVKTLLKFVKIIEPTHLVFAYDSKGKTFRHEMYADYKGTRPPMPEDLSIQVDILNNFVHEAKIFSIKCPGYEADDIIGTLSYQASLYGVETFILSGDKDDFQLIKPNVSVIYPQAFGNYTIYNEEKFMEKFDFEISSYVDYKAMLGDSSDNIPGIPGVGEKRASVFIKNFKNLESLYFYIEQRLAEANIDDSENIEKYKISKEDKELGFQDATFKSFCKNKKQAFFSRTLAQIKCDISEISFDIEKMRIPNFASKSLFNILDSLHFRLHSEFKALEDRLSILRTRAQAEQLDKKELNDMVSETLDSDANSGNTSNYILTRNTKYIYIDDYNYINKLDNIFFTNDEENFRKFILQPSLNAEKIYICQNKYEEYYKYLKTQNKQLSKKKDKFVDDCFLLIEGQDLRLDDLSSSQKQIFIFRIGKYKLSLLMEEYFDLIPDKRPNLYVDDLKFFIKEIIFNIKDENKRNVLNLTTESYYKIESFELAAYSVGYIYNQYPYLLNLQTLINTSERKPQLIAEIDDEVLLQEIRDLCSIPDICNILNVKLKDSGFQYFVDSYDKPLSYLTAVMEKTGVKIDLQYLQKMQLETEKDLLILEQEIKKEAACDFNLASPSQLSKVLFEDLKLRSVKKTKKAYSTDQSSLEEIKNEHIIIEKILQWRYLTKLLSSFIVPLLNLADHDDRVHTHYNLMLTATGRLSSVEPNLQNIPIRQDMGRKIRKAFIADKNKVLVSADYSQIELRLLAHISQDENMIKAYQNSLDIHATTAAKLFAKNQDELSFEERQVGKTINFSVIYGISEFSLAKDLGISYQDAKNYIAGYFQNYPMVAQYMSDVINLSSQTKTCKSLFGRIRYIDEFNSTNKNKLEFAKRVAMNSPIQASAADLIRKAMLFSQIKMLDHKLDAQLILQIHDELIFEVSEQDAQKAAIILQDSMENVITLTVPLKADVKIAKNWDDLKCL